MWSDMKDLTISNIERQNMLNNRFAISKVQEYLDIEGMLVLCLQFRIIFHFYQQ